MRAETWGQFKRAVEDEGVVDSTVIKRISYDPNETFSGLEVFRVPLNDEGRPKSVVITNEDY